MDICIAIIVLSLVMLGFMFYLMLSVHSMGMASLDDIIEKTPEEERRDEFDQMDEFDQLLAELDTPMDIFGEPLDRIDAGRRREEVIDELVKIGDTRAVGPLIKTAKKSEFYKGTDLLSDTRYSAIEALGKLGDKRAVKTLVKALGDDGEDVRYAAKKALEKLGHELE